ncbi:phosphopentomutase [Bacillus canaveralius]|uniref:Phosphopentomutase n=1 Tax=Bacillus canaveralius TaxID=1403243 RepID=A0A2N5GSD2_9BACI|nr:phosphopentomutase [Bacillus canaveralius]PLR86553.1 phosphopentomutase [Bacillus canaveralius]PLS00324.1 phosphopentomutase [Bacillus canaveralius]
MKKRAIVLILDSLGVGYMDDVKDVRPKDIGANTFYHILDQAKEISIPQLQELGINNIVNHPRLEERSGIASFGKMNLKHFGADSFQGHNEIMGTDPKVPFTTPFSTVMNEVKEALEKEGYQTEIPDPDFPYLLVNGLVIVANNIETDYGQIYNVTAPLDDISFDEVLKIGKIVRANVKVNRVIALGGENISVKQIQEAVEMRADGLVGVNSPKSGVYEQGYNCLHLGYGINPDTQAANILVEQGIPVTLIGKMQDVISCDGANKIPAVDTDFVMKSVLETMDDMEEGFIAATVQETDIAGHSQDVDLYAEKIMLVDQYLKILLAQMSEEDLLILSADHGNDPTIGHSQHTREKTFLLAYGKKLKNVDLGDRDSLSDIAATVTDFFEAGLPENGESFYPLLKGNSIIHNK